ncbi:hypothetical protein BGX26_012187 [Mortierella sp. AD094]|nr:hypothetical protein BGX26_012187 [Mortierella sp. AD094]
MVVELEDEVEKFGMKDDMVVVDDDDAVLIIRDMAENMLLVGIVVTAAAPEAAAVVAKADETPLLLDAGVAVAVVVAAVDGIEVGATAVVAFNDGSVVEKGFELVLLQY